VSSGAGGGGGGGKKKIDRQAAQQAASFLHGLQDQGYMIVMVSWRPAWLLAAEGEQVGPAVLACRPASLLTWIHDTMYDKLGVQPSGLACGFCVTGNSAGSSAIAYVLGFYGLDKIISGAVLTGGPPHAAFWKACLHVPGYEFEPGALGLLDVSYGFAPKEGPCYGGDQSWKPTWERDGADATEANHNYPDTRVLLLFGTGDTSGVGRHQLDYFHVLQQAGSPHVEQRNVQGMTHAITASSDGLRLIQGWFESS